MSKDKSFSDKTSADDKSIGFDYQYYYFLDKILNLKTGQSAGLEVKDDVHTELDVDVNILFQIKHTVQKNAAGDAKALTELDSDLWKTLYNWSQFIGDKTQGRGTSKEQLKYLGRTEFHLVTNKTSNANNKFLSTVGAYQCGDEPFDVLLSNIGSLEKKATDANIKSYIRAVLKMPKSVCKEFFQRIRFELKLDDVIGRVKQSILEKIIDADKVEQVFNRLDSNIRADNFMAVKRGEAIQISFEQFMQRYKRIFDDGRTKKLVYPPFTPDLPGDIFAQRFIQCLLDIDDISVADEELAIDYTKYKLRIATYLNQWVHTGDLVLDEVHEFHNEVFARWRNEFRVAFRGCNTADDIIEAALALLTTLRRERFTLGGTEINTTLSNGELYYLSDIERIGWHRDWEAK
ncbi:ABC-three component system protein [Cupriavidus taiwanensis]|uniref:ABC-three component system protein n=1 Tax=Cupriavidus taiwanensis TaxID=164546 RepID=UPI0011C05ECF|nr:ABC-three component system protein [Cupriavidus taiwanensis]